MTAESLTIARRFNGPLDSGNGGYVCGLLAKRVAGPAAVTLRLPPPLERPLQLEPAADGEWRLRDGEHLLAEARPTTFSLEVPAPPSFAEATAAARNFKTFEQAMFQRCFVCGPARTEDDGLHIFAGQVTGRTIVATPWVPAADLADADGIVRSEFVWAALDCPGAFSIYAPDRPKPILLGRLEAELLAPIRAGERYVVIGWPIRGEGRKRVAGTAIFDERQRLLAQAKAVWIELAGRARAPEPPRAGNTSSVAG